MVFHPWTKLGSCVELNFRIAQVNYVLWSFMKQYEVGGRKVDLQPLNDLVRQLC